MGARDAHFAHPLRRARIQREHLHLPRHRRHRLRPVQRDLRRHRRPARPEARRRERVLLRGFVQIFRSKRGGSGHRAPRAGEGDRHRLRPPGVHHRRSAQRGHQGRGAAALEERRKHEAVRYRRAARAGDVAREEDVRQPRLVQRGLLPHARRAHGDVHADLRHLARERLVGARHRAARRRQDHPAERQLHRPGKPAVDSTGKALSHVRIGPDQVHQALPRGASRGGRIAETGARDLLGQEAARALADAADAPRAEGRGQRVHLRAARRGRDRAARSAAARQGRPLMSAPLSNVRPKPDKVLTLIADYATKFDIKSRQAYETARYCLIDTLGCGLEALEYPACTKLLGPIVPAPIVPHGAKVPGTRYQLDPVQAAFNIGAMIRWLDFNDTWLAAEWGHPSDNLGAILAVADWLSRKAVMEGKTPPTVRDVLTGMIKAHEIQGVLALENSFNRVGLDHVILVRVASTAVVTAMLGGSVEQIVNAVSNAWIDGGALRTYRHAPNTGSRKSWAAGDATSRAVRHAFIALTGEMGYPSALSAKTCAFYDVLFRGQPFSLPQPFGSYVMENVLFKISYPAEFHAQTAVEAAIKLHTAVRDRLDQIEQVVISTQE